jgi:hypothetical protein
MEGLHPEHRDSRAPRARWMCCVAGGTTDASAQGLPPAHNSSVSHLGGRSGCRQAEGPSREGEGVGVSGVMKLFTMLMTLVCVCVCVCVCVHVCVCVCVCLCVCVLCVCVCVCVCGRSSRCRFAVSRCCTGSTLLLPVRCQSVFDQARLRPYNLTAV